MSRPPHLFRSRARSRIGLRVGSDPQLIDQHVSGRRHRNRSILGGVTVAGLAIGYTGVDHVMAPPERPDRILTLFTDVCLAIPRPTAPELTDRFGLVPRKPFDETTIWIDPVSGSFMTLADRNCQIQTSIPKPLNRADADHIARQLDTLVPDTFPELPFDPKAIMGDDALARAWLTGEIGKEKRWGIYFYAYPDWGESAGSTLSYKRAPATET